MAGADPMAIDNTGDPTFFMAADYHSGHETLQKYIDAGIDINTKNQNGFTLIHVAADDGTLDTFKLLHENGADILLVGENGETALHLAAANSDGYEILRYLLEQGVDLEADCERYGTPLMAAVRNGPLATRLLLERGARVNAISKSCVTHNALQAAADRGSSDIVRILLEAGADANIRGGSSGSALCAAVMSGDQDSVMLLLDKEENINYAEGPKGSALEIAMSHQLLEIAELFFQRDVDVNTIGRAKYGTGMGTPLIAAVDVGEIIAIEKLLELHADVNLFPTGGESPVQIAVRKGRQNIVEILVKNGAKLDYRDKNDRGVLSHAVFYKSLDLVPYLLQQPDVDIDQEDEFGRTPLIYATMHGSMIISRILARKPKIDVQDRWGKTALTYAVNRDYGLLVSMLIASHADPLIQDIRGRDALYWAALQPNSNTFALVLENMVKRNAPPSRFQHAIIAATTTDNSDFVRQLLKDSYPWKLDHADQDGWTAAYTALSYDRGNIASLISQAVNTTGRPRRDTVIQLKPPREWHPSDMSAYLIRQPDNLSIKVKSDVHIAIGDTFAIARADHPMVPNNDGIYYFEIKVVHGGNGKCLFGVGFCDDTAYFNNGMLGWQGGSWGYHGDDGRIFESGQASKAYGPKYDEGSIIGCGVNFKKGTSFYTIDGKVIGRAFTNIRGKIYPAVSVGAEMAGCILTARFWDEGENANKLFKFQGPYDILETLEPSQRYKDEAGAERVKNDDSDGGSSTSYDESD
ncbi:ankyrin repeat-containing domain protein [Xylaria arbuscula]|nr:ankyrin repeat-containing domain protein [Xylaria arbuscula]